MRSSTRSSIYRALPWRHPSSRPRSLPPVSRDIHRPTSMRCARLAEVVWCGIEPVGDRDGRLALYLTDHLPRLRMLPGEVEVSDTERALLDHLQREGASFFAALHHAAGDGYPAETVDALWNLVWKGLVTNDTFHAVRAFTRAPERRGRKSGTRSFRTRRVSPPSAEGGGRLSRSVSAHRSRRRSGPRPSRSSACATAC